MRKALFVYILTNYKNSVLYVGVTNNLERRVSEHKSGLVEGFTKRYRLYKLVWFQELASPGEAIRVEKMIKGWKREKKIKLVEEANSGWEDLGETLR